jgi:hypothetical protein
MFGLNALRSAIATLTANVLGLAGTVAQINTGLRQRAALDGPEAADSEALTLDGKAPGVAQDAAAGTDTPPADPTPPSGRNGRRRVAAAAQ